MLAACSQVASGRQVDAGPFGGVNGREGRGGPLSKSVKTARARLHELRTALPKLLPERRSGGRAVLPCCMAALGRAEADPVAQSRTLGMSGMYNDRWCSNWDTFRRASNTLLVSMWVLEITCVYGPHEYMSWDPRVYVFGYLH